MTASGTLQAGAARVTIFGRLVIQGEAQRQSILLRNDLLTRSTHLIITLFSPQMFKRTQLAAATQEAYGRS